MQNMFMTHTDLKLTYVNNTFNSPVNEDVTTSSIYWAQL